MYRFILIVLMLLTCLLPFTAAAATEKGTVPTAAEFMAQQMDGQIVRHLKNTQSSRWGMSILATVPVSLSDMNLSSPIARQISEEMMSYFVEAGYRVDEMRKGREIRVDQDYGEMLLTRNTSRMLRTGFTTNAVLSGTYTLTRDSIRFNMRLLHTPSNTVIAASSATVPITPDIYGLVADRRKGGSSQPSVQTRLR